MQVKGFVLIEKEGRYLLIQEASFKWKGQWFLPGGGPKPNETPEMAAKRETLEEAGCEVSLDGIFYIRHYQGTFEHRLHLFYCGTIGGDKIKTSRDKHSLGAQWFTYEELVKLPLRQNLLEVIDAHYRLRGNIAMPTHNFQTIRQ